MADVFISYSRHDRLIAEELAENLRARGLDVWWDIEIYAGEIFHEVIEWEIKKATAVIVIWSEHSVKSRWVLSEANLAFHDDKLIGCPTSGFTDVPFLFRITRSVNVADREAIFEALLFKGVGPSVLTVQGLDRELVELSRTRRIRNVPRRKAFLSYALSDRRQVQAVACAYEAGEECPRIL